MHHPLMLNLCAIVLVSIRVSLTRRNHYESESSTHQAEAVRLVAGTAGPVTRSKRKLGTLEKEAGTKWQQEVALVKDAVRHGPNFLRNNAWRSVHGVRVGVEWQGSKIESVVGGVARKFVYKKSLNECFAACEAVKQCVAWSWHQLDKKCHAMSSCTGRVGRLGMVSGTKASLDGVWVYKASEQTRFGGFYITVEKNGEMTFENADGEYGKLEMVAGSAHDTRQTMDEWEAQLDPEDTDAGMIRLRLTDGKIKLKSWMLEQGQFKEFTAEKKQVRYESYDRVTLKEDQVIAASDVWVQGGIKDFQTLSLRKGDSGTVDNVYHPRKTGVSFDQDPGKTVWVNDALLVRAATLKEVSEDEVKSVYMNLEDALLHAIQDPLTLEVFRDPVIASDGYTYERSAIEQLITNAEESREAPKSPMTREPFSDVKLSTNHAMRSLVSSVIEKVDAARAAAGKIQKHYRGYRVMNSYVSAPETTQAPVTRMSKKRFRAA